MCGLLRLWGILCAVAAQSVQNAALALQGKAVLRHQVGPHLIHKAAVQVVDAPAARAFEVQMLPAVAALVLAPRVRARPATVVLVPVPRAPAATARTRA